MKSPEAASLRSELAKSLSGGMEGHEAELLQRADFLIEAKVQSMAAEERRRAVLEGLSALGYEVSEGMATAWVEGGRVVLRKARQPRLRSRTLRRVQVGSPASQSGCVRQFDRDAGYEPGPRHRNYLVRRVRTASVVDSQGRRKSRN
jgi:hypothetical protein